MWPAQRLSRRARASAALCLLGLAVAACGEHATLSIDPGIFFGDTTFGAIPSGSLTTGERMRALDGLQSVVNGLKGGGNFDSETQTLVAYIKGRPQFAAAGSSADGTAWGQFKDGTLLFVVTSGPPNSPTSNRAPEPALASSAVRPAPFTAVTLRSLVTTSHQLGSSDPGDVGTVPSSSTFLLLDGVGNAFPGDPRATIEPMLEANGYTGARLPALLPTLRTAVANIGVFYFRTYHGSASLHPDSDIYTNALWTASTALDSTSEANDPILLDDLKQQRVVYMLYRSGRWQPAVAGLEPNRHYGITPSFITKYMSFSDNSLVYLDAGGSPEGWGFPNASLGIGWGGPPTFDAAGRTAAYVFDRLLGANVYAPETPAQRPFPYNALRLDPKFGHGQIFGYSFFPLPGANAEADLQMVPLKGQFGMLAPGIFGLVVDEQQNRLLITGDFGPNPGPDGKVTIDDGSGEQPLRVVEWTPSDITTELQQTGRGSSGNVVVAVRGHRSNARQLMEWQGTFSYTVKEAGSLTQTWQLDLRARLDPQEQRILPGYPPIASPIAYTSMSDGFQAHYGANGSATVTSGCKLVTTWAANGSGTVMSKFPPVSLTTYTSEGSVDLKRRVWTLAFDAAVNGGLKRDVTATCGTTVSHSISSEDLLALPWEQTSSGDDGVFILPLDDGLNLQASSRQKSEASGIDPSAQRKFTVSWGTIIVRPRFAPSLPR